MAGRGIGTAQNVGAKKVGRELLRPLVWIMVMMQITDQAWKDTITQIVEEDSAACERDGLDVVPAGSMTKVRSSGSAAAW